MADIFSAPHFHDDTEARKVLEGIAVAGWPGLPALRRDRPRLCNQAARRVSLRRKGMPQGLHRHDEDRDGAQQDRPA